MQIYVATESNIDSLEFYNSHSLWFYSLSIILTQYYLTAAPYIKQLDIFKSIVTAHLKSMVIQPAPKDIEEYIDRRKELIREIKLHERQREQEQRESRRAGVC